MADLAKVDEQLSQKIQDLMFIFDDLQKVDDRGMQELLRQVPADKLLIALKGADDTLKAQDLQEHVAARGRDDEGRPRGQGPGEAVRSRGGAEGNPRRGPQAGRCRHDLAGQRAAANSMSRQGRRSQPPSRAGTCRRSKGRWCSAAAPASTSCTSRPSNATPGSRASRPGTPKACGAAKPSSRCASTSST